MSDDPNSGQKEAKIRKIAGNILKEKPVCKPDDKYSLDEKDHLGHALIVNNVAKTMPGSQIDVEALTIVYKKIGFDVTVKLDCDVAEMNDLALEMTHDENHKESNCFMLTVISHGDEGILKSAQKDKEGKYLMIGWEIEDIVKRLNEVKKLIGKPKILVFCSCRGEESSAGHAAEALGNPEMVADYSDFYISYGAAPRQITPMTGEGSKFLTSLANNLRHYYNNHSIDRIFTCVRHHISTIPQKVKKHGTVRQCPEDRTTLRKLLMFSEFEKSDEVEPLEWKTKEKIEEITGEKLGAKSRDAAPTNTDDQRKPLDQPDWGKQSTAVPQVQRTEVTQWQTQNQAAGTKVNTQDNRRKLTPIHISNLAKKLNSSMDVTNLATYLDVEAGTHLGNYPKDITKAAYDMLTDWRNNIEDEHEQYSTLETALDKANLKFLKQQLKG